MMTFDVSAPYEVEEFDAPFARPQGLELLARVYRPRGHPAGLPALVDVHGGAWNSNDRTTGALHGRALAACGAAHADLAVSTAPAPLTAFSSSARTRSTITPASPR